MGLAEQLVEGIKVKVYKKNADGRRSLCGEKVQVDGKGREFFAIPGHQRDYIKSLFEGQYEIGEEYLPEVAGDAAEKGKLGRPKGS